MDSIEQNIQQPQLASEDQRKELIDKITQIQSKLNSFNAIKFASGNKSKIHKTEMLKQVLEKLQLAGVNLADTASVSKFIEDLRQKNPELAAMFEKSMEYLLSDEGATTSPQQEAFL